MAKRWMLAALLACGLAQTPAQAQWGFNGEKADPRYDPCVAGNANAEAAVNMPSLEINADYLMWWLRDPRFGVPLTTLGGSIPQDGLDYDDPFAGARLAARFWYDNTQTGSVEIIGLILGENSSTRLVSTAPGSGLLASSTSKMWGAEGNLVVDTLHCGLELIGGFRTLDLQEQVNLSVVAPGIAVLTQSEFKTRNQFYGGQIGGRASYRFGPVTVGALAKVAFGETHQTIQVTGTSTSATGVVTVGTGPFVAAANRGKQVRNEFSVLPEAEARIGLEVTNGVILYASYDVLWLTGALRPGDQISGTAVAPGPVSFNDTHLWAQGLNFGLEVRY